MEHFINKDSYDAVLIQEDDVRYHCQPSLPGIIDKWAKYAVENNCVVNLGGLVFGPGEETETCIENPAILQTEAVIYPRDIVEYILENVPPLPKKYNHDLWLLEKLSAAGYSIVIPKSPVCYQAVFPTSTNCVCGLGLFKHFVDIVVGQKIVQKLFFAFFQYFLSKTWFKFSLEWMNSVNWIGVRLISPYEERNKVIIRERYQNDATYMLV